MRILILTNKMPYPPKDGGSIASLSLALALENCGNKVDILTMNTSKHYYDPNKIPTSITDKVRFFSVNINTKINPIRLSGNLLFSQKPYNAQRFISAEFSERLADLLKTENYDVVQLEGLYLCPYINNIKNNSNAKISLRSHNIEHEIWQRAAVNETNKVLKLYKKNLSLRIKKFKLKYLNQYDFLVPITERDANIYNQLGNLKKVIVTPTGIDSNNSKFNMNCSGSEFPGFFHIGALDWIPNQEGLTWFINKIWLNYTAKHPNFVFNLAGRNASEAFEKNLLNKNVKFWGEVESADDFIAKGSVMIVPLLSGSGMRIKIIEGMAAGKTIITTTIGTEGIATTHNENILIADTPNEFITQLERICSDQELHLRISKNAKDFVRHNYDNIEIAKHLSDFYKENINK